MINHQSMQLMTNLTISSIIIFLISGPFIPDLIVSISSLTFLIFAFKKKLFSYFLKKPLIIFFIFCLYSILISFFVAEDTLLSFESSLFYFRIGIFSCLVWYLIERDKLILLYFYYILLFCFSLLIIDGYFQFIFKENILGFPQLRPDRISSFFGEELILGSYLSRLFPLLFALFILKNKKKYEILFYWITICIHRYFNIYFW